MAPRGFLCVPLDPFVPECLFRACLESVGIIWRTVLSDPGGSWSNITLLDLLKSCSWWDWIGSGDGDWYRSKTMIVDKCRFKNRAINDKTPTGLREMKSNQSSWRLNLNSQVQTVIFNWIGSQLPVLWPIKLICLPRVTNQKLGHDMQITHN